MVFLLLPTPRGSQTPGLNTPGLMRLPPEPTRTQRDTHAQTHTALKAVIAVIVQWREKDNRENKRIGDERLDGWSVFQVT